MNLAQQQQQFNLVFEGWLQAYLAAAQKNKNYAEILLKSQSYSLLSGGKRFRPLLAYLVFKLFASAHNQLEQLKNFCLALEMIHTYSLIHDDLPCMDNDDVRRGKPSNHKVFSEDISLLAGDGLLTDVFFLLADAKDIKAEAKINLIKLVAEKIGSMGMVSGQVFDMQADQQLILQDLRKIHLLKTANLIQTSAVGAAIIADCAAADLHNISEFSYNLGMAFQIKDDLLDGKPDGQNKQQDCKSYLHFLGLEKTKDELSRHSMLARQQLKTVDRKNTAVLLELVDFNLVRSS